MVTRVPIVLGGTGADNAADARANLGVLSATGNVVVSNIVIGSGNVLHSVSGANVTFDPPGTTVAGAQFMTPGIHDLATQRIVTLKSNNYSGNRGTGGGDYVVPTMNIKAKYNNVAINTAGRVIFSNRYDSETDMPDTAKYEGLVTFDRNPGGPGVLLYANARNRHKILTANADITPGTNIQYSIGTAALQWRDVRIANDIITTSGNVITRGLQVGGTALFIQDPGATATDFKIGMGTNDPQFGVDIRSNVYISGNLTVKGNTYVTDTNHLIVDDPVIELGANTVGAPTLDTGVLMNRGSSANAFIGYDESSDQFITALTSDPSSVTTITVGSYAPIQTGPLHTNYLANIAGNASVSRSLAVGYTDHRVPQANLDVTGNVIINGTTTDDFLVLKTTDAGALSAPDVIFYRMSASPADDDYLGKLTFRGRNDNTQDVEYAQIISQIVDASDGTEDGKLYLQTKVNGSDINHITLDSTGTTFTDVDVTFTGAATNMVWDKSDNRLEFADNTKLSFGTGDDFEIYHSTDNNTYLTETGSGNLHLRASNLYLDDHDGTQMLLAAENAAVTLYHNGVQKLATASNGAISTGNLTPSANVVFSLGQPEKAWKELWLQGNSLHLGNTSISIGKTGEVEFMKTNKLGQPVTSVDVANVHASIDAGGVLSFYSANTTGNVSLGRGLAVGYVGEKVPGANLDVNGNAYISGATTIGGAATFDDNLYVADNIRHKGDTDTYIEFTTDKIRTIAGGKALITATEATTDTVIINDGGNDLDFRVEGIDDENLLFTDGLNNRVGIGTSSPSALFHVDGNTVIARSVAIGYTDGRVPQANLDVKGNTFVSGKITGTMTPTFMGANVVGNVSVTRGLAVGYTDGRVPQANLDVKGNVYIDGNTHVRDQQILSFGTGKDLQLFHDGSHSYIKDAGTGNLIIAGESTWITNVATDETIAKFVTNGAVELYYDNAKKLETTGTGVAISGIGANVTGNVSVTRSLAVGWTDGRVPQANLEVIGNANVGILTATSLRINGSPVSTTSTFTGLTDTPSSYSGQAGKLTAVNSSANALEFVDDNAVVMAIALG